MAALDSGVELDQLLEPSRREATGLLAVTMRDGRTAELWLDQGRVSYLICPGVRSLAARLEAEIDDDGWAEAVGRAEAGGSLVVELVRVGIDIDVIRDRLGDLGREVVAEIASVGIAEVRLAESGHPFLGSGWVDLPALVGQSHTGATSPRAPSGSERLVAAPMPDEVGEIRLDAGRWAVALALAVPGTIDEVTTRTGLASADVEDSMARLFRVGLLRVADDAEDPASVPITTGAVAEMDGPTGENSQYASNALRHLIEGVREL